MSWNPAVGETAKDGETGKIGRVMAHVGPYVQLRPLSGGKEWDARQQYLEPVSQSDALSAALAEVNARSSGRV